MWIELRPRCSRCGQEMEHDGVGWLCPSCLREAGVVQLVRRGSDGGGDGDGRDAPTDGAPEREQADLTLGV